MQLGAKGVINRKDFSCWGQMPTVGTPEYDGWVKEARKFGKAIWDITGKRDVDIVFEHPGEATFPVSCLVVKRGGMVVFCAGTSGYNLTFDARYVWMRQKRIQGSHFAHLKQASAANQFVLDRRIDPCRARFCLGQDPHAHELMRTTDIRPATWRCWSTRRARDCARLTTWWRRVADRSRAIDGVTPFLLLLALSLSLPVRGAMGGYEEGPHHVRLQPSQREVACCGGRRPAHDTQFWNRHTWLRGVGRCRHRGLRHAGHGAGVPGRSRARQQDFSAWAPAA